MAEEEKGKKILVDFSVVVNGTLSVFVEDPEDDLEIAGAIEALLWAQEIPLTSLEYGEIEIEGKNYEEQKAPVVDGDPPLSA